MAQHLHIVFGGELVKPSENVFKDPENVHVVGIFQDRKSAYDAWKTEAQRTVDNAHMRYFVGDLQKLMDSSTSDPDPQD
jgi:allantoicase